MRKRGLVASAVAVVACCVLLSCAAAREVVTERIIRIPSVRIISGEITRLSFTGAAMLFDIEITNSNPVGLALDGFDYNLLIEDEPFLHGRQEGKVEIGANGSSIVPLPLESEFAGVYHAFERLVENDGASYTLEMACFFDLPVLGKVEVPARTEGRIPLVKPPVLSLRSLRVARIGLTSADVVLEAALDNPNDFFFDAPLFRYEVVVNEKTWARGSAFDLHIGEKRISMLSFPFTVRYAEVSESLYRLLTAGEKATCVFKGSVDIKTPLPLLTDVSLPFEIGGEVPLMR
ncbi:MAG: LEA type 2 family protein [Spirochaetes bacterium]|nr:LEA type 2 family protein [Spirochaetota bacterium]